MYKQRLHVFISLCFVAVFTCIVRLAFLQVVKCNEYRSAIEASRILPPVQLPTVRGSIFDRNGKALAMDKPVFYIQINYQLTRLMDDRFWEGSIQSLLGQNDGMTREEAENEIRAKYADKLLTLMRIIETCAEFESTDREKIEVKIRVINDRMWNNRRFFAWLWEFPNSEIIAEYKAKGKYITHKVAFENFDLETEDDEQLRLIMKVRLSEMFKSQPLVELKSDSELLDAQQAIAGIKEIEILPVGERAYPHGSAACQIIGWAGPAGESEKKLFSDDKYSEYRAGEVAGKDGVEKICEAVLRGRRGEVTYNKDGEKLEYLTKEAQFGEDVRLSIHITLQRNIEEFLADPNRNPEFDSAIGAVVIDVGTGDILSLVSMPVYDLNTVRREYNNIRDAVGVPMINKSLYELYPPGSTIKPLILIAGMQEGKVGSGDVISCPGSSAPPGWPNCLLFRKGGCHDWRWADEGGNIARNAVRGSCNVYFSRLANRLDGEQIQRWLYDFGFGRRILEAPSFGEQLAILDRDQRINGNLRQSAGQISSKIPYGKIETVADMPRIETFEKRMFGIGQGGLRVTVLQLANAFAAIARDGVYKSPRLFIEEYEHVEVRQRDLGVSAHTTATVREGMRAVVMETSGTANDAFKGSVLHKRDVKVFGKTGSTENPENALFTGFAEDRLGRAVAFALLLEGGQAGGGQAAPMVEQILVLCNEAGYIGQRMEGDIKKVEPDESLKKMFE